jgi:hypothetical protein
VLAAVLAQQRLIQPIARVLGAGMGVHVHQARDQPPAINHRLCTGQGIKGDLVADDVQVAFLVLGQDDAVQVVGHPAPPERAPSTPALLAQVMLWLSSITHRQAAKHHPDFTRIGQRIDRPLLPERPPSGRQVSGTRG